MSSNHLGALGVNRPPKSKNSYLSSQAGVLTYLSNDKGIWADTGQYPALEDLISSWTSEILLTEGFYTNQPDGEQHRRQAIKEHFDPQQPLLRKIVLGKEHVPVLRQLLKIEGISKAHLMPTYDNLASTSLDCSIDAVLG